MHHSDAGARGPYWGQHSQRRNKMRAISALPILLVVSSLGMASDALAFGFSYQKQWWPQAVITRDGRSLGSGEAYEYAGPSGPDIWMTPGLGGTTTIRPQRPTPTDLATVIVDFPH